MNKIPFSPPDIGEEEINEVIDTLRSGWITTGPKTKEFERQISKYIFGEETGRCVCLNSWTASAEMTLRLLGLKPGDEVITSAYTYTATASVALHIEGVKLVLVDTEKDSVRMDKVALTNAITSKTKVIIPVDIGGVPEDLDEIIRIAEEKKDIFNPDNEIQEAIGRIVVLEDAAHAFGASYKGRNIGTISDFTCFSFHAVKNLTTAEGGAVLWKHIEGIEDKDIYKKYQLLSLHGQSKDAFNKNQAGAWEYDIVGPWYKCNMTDIQAAIGLAQLKRYKEMLQKRKSIIERYNDAFSTLPVRVLNHYTNEYVSSGHLYIMRITGATEDERNSIIIKMAEKGVATNVHYKPLQMFTAYNNLGFSMNNYHSAYSFYSNEITLPLYSLLSYEDTECVIDAFIECLRGFVV